MKNIIIGILSIFIISCSEQQEISKQKLPKGKFYFDNSIVEFIPINDSTIQQKFIINNLITYNLELKIHKKKEDSIFVKTDYKDYYVCDENMEKELSLIVLNEDNIHYYPILDSKSRQILTPLKK